MLLLAVSLMGQVVQRVLSNPQNNENDEKLKRKLIQAYNKVCGDENILDIGKWPPELSLLVLSHLNPTELWLAACVWGQLAQDNSLWLGLCKTHWQYATIYNKESSIPYWRTYLTLDEGTLTFNVDPFQGLEYFLNHEVIEDNPKEIARFIHHTNLLKAEKIRLLLDSRRDVMEHVITLQNYKNQFLPNALRKFFQKVQAPNDRGNYIETILEMFSTRFCQCNPHLGLTTETVYILCFSLILLSVDLSSPHVKNKMSKREFIRNIRSAIQRPDDDLAGHLYDNIYLKGHIAGCR